MRKENEQLRRELDLSKQWMQLCVVFRKQGLSPPTFPDDDTEPSKTKLPRSQTIVSKQTRGPTVAARKPLRSTSKVGES